MRILILPVILLFSWPLLSQELPKLQYNHPGLVVDLGVGLWAWPLPMDYDKDGDLDLVVACPDVPYRGIYFFENPGGKDEMPIFKAGKKISPGSRNLQLSQVDNEPVVMGPGTIYQDFREKGLEQAMEVPLKVDFKKIHGRTRANQWKSIDYDDDGDQDLLIGLGVWEDYGWDNAYDENGQWKNGPLHGYVYLSLNEGTDVKPKYAPVEKLTAGNHSIDVYGMPSPNLADFDNDGDLDLICGEFLDGFTYFQNTGSRSKPEFQKGKKLRYRNQATCMDLQMITPVAIDWNSDGHVDLIVGDEDGRVAFMKNTGKLRQGIPEFPPPVYFQQEARDVKFGALVTPFAFDWDADGDQDLICGNTAGYLGFIENLNGDNPPRWAAPKYLRADDQVVRPMAGSNGSIQGPCEAKWGYSTLSVADWDLDGLPDIVINSIWGKVIWYQNVGTLKAPVLTAARPITVEWSGVPAKPAWNWWPPKDRELATQWRTTPYVIDWNQDQLPDLIMLDQEGYLAFFERYQENGQLRLKPPKRIFKTRGPSVYDSKNRPQKGANNDFLQLNHRIGGGSGRRKFCFVDWDQDGKLDLLLNSVNVNFFRNTGTDQDGHVILEDQGALSQHELAGHTTSPTTVDWNKDGTPDLLIGAEDGRFYYLEQSKKQKK